ncbi:hypothetical protein C1I98_12920 [Spongiactinospora gelatinilytica]|uniref:MFS transporter n=1 Tax=Spongiactinospora gelatinilytica TaxID=2666298 RepID=A0A2W2HEW2_9ACTN|nr:MFS transporter [Spongiactinospora gelatinilytica]PZG48098.1 hypothetical protein C1I98_12920 [Spongiactinospora gelatinilytica]
MGDSLPVSLTLPVVGKAGGRVSPRGPPILRRPTVKWGNLGGLATVGMATATTFLMTIYLQDVLGYSATVTGLALGIPGLAAFAGSVAAPAMIGRYGPHAVLSAGLAIQGVTTASLLLTGADRGAITLVVVVVGACFAGNMAAVVAFTVTATSRIPDHEQGLATGIATMTPAGRDDPGHPGDQRPRGRRDRPVRGGRTARNPRRPAGQRGRTAGGGGPDRDLPATS